MVSPSLTPSNAFHSSNTSDVSYVSLASPGGTRYPPRYPNNSHRSAKNASGLTPLFSATKLSPGLSPNPLDIQTGRLVMPELDLMESKENQSLPPATGAYSSNIDASVKWTPSTLMNLKAHSKKNKSAKVKRVLEEDPLSRLDVDENL